MRLWVVMFGLSLCVSAPLRAEEISRHWEFAGWHGGGAYPALAMDPQTVGRVYLASDVTGVYRSDDYGRVWEPKSNGLANLHVAALAVAPSDTNVVYAGTKVGLFVSRDAGESWEAADKFDKELTFAKMTSGRGVAVSAADPGRVCVGSKTGRVACSYDYGASWVGLGTKGAPFGEKAIRVVAFAMGEQVLWVGSAEGLARYDFGTKNWQLLPEGPKPVGDMTVLGKEPEVLYVAGGQSIWISEDAGETWWPTAQAPKGVFERVAVHRDESHTWIGAVWNKDWDGGVVASTDRGAAWVNMNTHFRKDALSNPTSEWHGAGGRTAALVIAPHNAKVLLRSDWWGIWRSEDGGHNWAESVVGAPNTVGSDIVIDRGRILVATMDNGLLASNDNGTTYRCLFPKKGYDADINGHAWRIAMTGPERSWILATSSPWGRNVNQVALSRDAGETFAMVRDGLPEKRPTVGTHWGQGYPRALAVDPFDGMKVYLGIDGDDGGGLFRSLDGGMTWKRMDVQPPSLKVYNGLSIDPRDATRIAWGACGDAGGVYLTEDGGGRWERVLTEMSWVFDLKFAADGTLYAGGDRSGPALYAAKQSGRKWRKLKQFPGKGTVEAITLDPEHPERILVSTTQWNDAAGGRIWLSEDGGKLWIDITGDLPAGSGAAAMAISPDGWLYQTRYAGSVYRMRL